jgi:predicted membrane channel-forming protein YqfA (hemolysin III family)
MSGIAQVLFFESIWDILLLAALSIAGILAGIGLRVKSFLYLGSAFLVLDVVVNLFRIGLEDRIIGMVFLFATGVLILVAAVFFNLKRDEVLGRYREIRGELEQW